MRTSPIVLLSTLLAVGWCLLGAGPAQASGWRAPVVSTASQRQVCADFLFIGVRGSGEPLGYGPTVTGVRDGVKKRWQREGSVRQVYLDYPAAAPQTLAEVPFEQLLFSQPMRSTQYFDSARHGAAELTRVLQDSLGRCPHERIMLAGFSQGAQVITSALATTRPGDRLVAAVLLGNPSHYPRQNVREVDGSAPDTAIGMGSALHLLRETGTRAPNRQTAVEWMLQKIFDITEGKANPAETAAAMRRAGAEISAQDYPTTYSVCLSGDLVCDAGAPLGRILVNETTLIDEINRTRPIHLNYTEKTLAATLDEIYASAAAVDLTPPPGSPGVRRLPGRPTWYTTVAIGLGTLMLGFTIGLVRGRAVGRASMAAAIERRRAVEADTDSPD